jgi:hypothetical protein
MQIVDNETNQPELRIIKTARNEQAINKAVEQGYWPLVKPVIPSPDIKVKFAVSQNKTTGRITVAHDYRDPIMFRPIEPVGEISEEKPETLVSSIFRFLKGKELVPPVNEEATAIDWTYYYPYHFESPFAAYLIPKDLRIDETVFLEDLIEDVIGGSWNQGDKRRLSSCKAVWDGKEFILQYDINMYNQPVLG